MARTLVVGEASGGEVLRYVRYPAGSLFVYVFVYECVGVCLCVSVHVCVLVCLCVCVCERPLPARYFTM